MTKTKIQSTFFALGFALALGSACSEQGGSNPPPTSNSNTSPSGGSGSSADTGSGTSGATAPTSGVDSSGDSTGPTCEDCPEEEPGVCPGHAQWNRGLVLYGVWQNDAVPSVLSSNPATDIDDPVCSQSFPVCLEYADPNDIDEQHAAELLAAQMVECNALTNGQAQARGLGPVAGWTLVHHVCRTEQGGVISFDGEMFTLPDNPGADVCNDAPWAYESYCSPESCPMDESGSTGGTSTGSTGGAGVDCSEFNDGNLDWTHVEVLYSSPTITYIARTATVDAAATAAFVADPYAVLSECSEALIDPNTRKLWSMAPGSFLGYLGLVKNDVVFSVNGLKGLVEIIDSMAMDIDQGNTTKMKIKRQTTVYVYTISWDG